jgi:hypothetical protein
MSTESAANLSRSLIQVEAFIPPETEALVRVSAEQTGVDLNIEENVLHVSMLRLIATERRRNGGPMRTWQTFFAYRSASSLAVSAWNGPRRTR